MVALLLLWAVSEIAIPGMAASYARGEIKKRYPDAQGVSVSVRAFPAVKLAFKKYDRLTVKCSNVTLQGVLFNDILLNSRSWPAGEYSASIGQDEITRFFSIEKSYISDPRIVLAPTGIVVTGRVNTGFSNVNVEATGSLEPVDGRYVFFRPVEIKVAGATLPGQATELVRQVMEKQPVFVVRMDLPYLITRIQPEGGKLVLTGTVDMEKALNIKL